jgi:CRP-like cAMP-binding protein/ATP/ADP translocase/HEAT repeat protein
MGISTVFFETAASALFLSRFEADLLPYVYIAAAVLNTLTGFVYARIRQRLPFARLMISTLVFLLFFVSLFRIGLSLTDAAWLFFGLLIWYRVLSILTDLEYWAVATRIYDVRQSKRLFSLVGSGEVVARITGSFSVPLLVGLIGVPNLLAVSAVGLLGCLIVLLIIFRAFPLVSSSSDFEKEETKKNEDDERDRSKFSVLLRDRYLQLIFGLAVFAVLGKYFVDFAFLAEMQTRYNDVERLAGFFGIFSGVTQAVNLLMRVFVSGRLLNRFGMKVGLVTLPIVHTLCTLLIIVAGGFDAHYWIFWLVISNQGIYKTLKHPIDNPSFKVLYQPLRARDRLSAQIAVEVIVSPITIGFAGVIMLLFSAVIPFDPVQFAYIMLAAFVAWVVLAIFAFRQYSISLLKALEKRTLDGTTLSIDDEQSLDLIRSKLLSDNAVDVIFSLDLLKKVEHPSLGSHLVSLLSHPSADVRRYVLLELEEMTLVEAVEPVKALLEEERNPEVCAAALRCLAAMGGKDSLNRVAGYLEHESLDHRRGALIGLLRCGDSDTVDRAMESLELLTNSTDTRDRILATQVLAEAQSKGTALLLELLLDAEPEVRESALRSAGRSGDPAFVPILVDHLNNPRYRPVSTTSLVNVGEGALPGLAETFSNRDLSHQTLTRIARICRRISGPKAVQVLWEGFGYKDPVVRKEVLASLLDCKYEAFAYEADAVKERIREEVADATWKLASIRDLKGDDKLELVIDSLSDEIDMNRERILILLSFIFDPKSIRTSRENLKHVSREKRAYALEILDVTLPSEFSKLVLPLAETSSPREKLRTLEPFFPQSHHTFDERLREILERSEEWLTPWSKACTAYSSVKLPDVDLSATLKSIARISTSPLLAETARWALALRQEKPEPSNSHEAGRMLTIEKVILLKGVEMFSHTSEEILAEVATILEEVDLQAGEVIFDKGDVGESMYIIVDGRVRIFDGDKTINYLDEKEIFGELALLDPEPRSASVEAVEETRLFRLDRDTFFELMADNIGVVSGVMRVLCQRLRRMTTIATETVAAREREQSRSK